MVITMNDSKLSSIVEVKRFLQESHVIEFKKRFRKEAYQWIEETSIPNARIYLKESVTLERLDKTARRYTDNEMAKKVQLERNKLFDKILAA